MNWWTICGLGYGVVVLGMWLVLGTRLGVWLGFVGDEPQPPSSSPQMPPYGGHLGGEDEGGKVGVWMGVALAALAWLLTSCVGDNLADMAQAQAAAEAARAAQEAAQAAQVAAGGLAWAVVAPWVIAVVVVVTAAGWVWVRVILPGVRPGAAALRPYNGKGERRERGEIVVRELPMGREEKPMTMEELFRIKMMRDLMKDDEERRF